MRYTYTLQLQDLLHLFTSQFRRMIGFVDQTTALFGTVVVDFLFRSRVFLILLTTTLSGRVGCDVLPAFSQQRLDARSLSDKVIPGVELWRCSSSSSTRSWSCRACRHCMTTMLGLFGSGRSDAWSVAPAPVDQGFGGKVTSTGLWCCRCHSSVIVVHVRACHCIIYFLVVIVIIVQQGSFRDLLTKGGSMKRFLASGSRCWSVLDGACHFSRYAKSLVRLSLVHSRFRSCTRF